MKAMLHIQALLPWDTFACHQLGAMYATGEGARKDERAAVRWYRRGARRGDPESQYDLGFMLLLGEGVAADTEEAVRWLVRAASAGHGPAAELLADLYGTGVHGVPVSEADSRRWVIAAASWRQG